MCTAACLEFGERALTALDVRGKSVLEVGSRIVQGEGMSLRPHIERLRPAAYLGVDIAEGLGVDEMVSVYDLADRFGEEAFDLVVSTEVVEHLRDWRSAFHNLKAVLRDGGTLLLTTRSPGFAYHGWPHDYWRYTQDDMRAILADMEIQALENDPTPGVLVKARKPEGFIEADLGEIRLFSILGRKPRRYPPSRFHAILYERLLRSFRWARQHKRHSLAR
jgi:SAM-dependent methyltransferase